MPKFRPNGCQDRWRIFKCGKHVLNACTRAYFYSGAVLSLALGLTGLSGAALANPEGGTVVDGSATITQDGNTLTVDQDTSQVLIEWSSFNIDSGETTQFNQPSSSALAVNRITSESQLSLINGNLYANGRIVIINPNGVLIGPDGNIDTAAFLATTADIKDEDFASGAEILEFSIAGSYDGIIENDGTITVSDTGRASLITGGPINPKRVKLISNQLTG